MKTILRVSAMLAAVLGVLSLPAAGQSPAGSAPGSATNADAKNFDVAVNFTYKVAKISESTNRFILPGGSVDAAYNFAGRAHGLALVIDLNGESASNVEPGVNLTQFSVLGGARYTFQLANNSAHAVALYGEVLGGRVFASNSVFPGPSSVTSSANSGALQTGGGANLRLTHSFSLRLVEADFIMTQLPNAANNRQYDLRLSNGVVFRF